ncbi:MAG: hypothetical protein ACR652_16690 [Methylocystis sp.]|uniref:hypothetical protein n=1 Tax=Methylocystis sp. TaxID=1911079 RepID=UPI003DA60C9F
MQQTLRAPLAPLVAAALIAGCALRHDEIAPDPIPPAAYASADCRQLAQMQAKTNRTLIFSEIAQDHRYAEDRTRTFGVPMPMALLFEERGEANVARLKGDSLALAAQLERGGCLRDGG